MSQNSYVTINVYNLLGDLVETLVNNASTDAGVHVVEWDLLNNSSIASGIYLVHIEAEGASFSATRKIAVVK